MTNQQLHSDDTLEFALELRAMTAGTPEEQAVVRAVVEQDAVAFLMAGGWTKVVKEVTDDGTERPAETSTQPFIPWESQQGVIRGVVNNIRDGNDVVWAKSREMGA